MTVDIASLVSDNLDIWTTSVERKSGTGRGGGKRINLYGIDSLRALILDLAVRGKLVSQDSNEEPAADLLKRIRKAKAQRVLSGEIRKPRRLDNDHNLKPPFSIPDTWQWIRLDEVGAIVGGGTPPAGNAGNFVDGGQGVPWLTPADLGGYKGRFIFHGERDLTEAGLKASSATVMPTGSVLFTSRAPIGYVVIAANPISTNQGFKSIVPYIAECSPFIATAMKSFAKTINDNAPGTTFKEVSGKMVAALPFPLPPIAEQRRIVAKVDELMALCDALETESASAIAAHQTLVEALLATLTDSTDAADLASNWARLEAHFDSLFTTEASVDALKQTILDLAVRGKLVEQDESDGAASDLLKKIIASNSERVAAGDAKKMRSKSVTPSGSNPIDLPLNWAWTSLDRIAYKITDGAHHTPTYTDDGVPFLSVKDMSAGSLDFSDTRFISAEEHADLYRRCDPEKGDLLITKVGTTGVPVVVDTAQPFSLFVSVALIKAPWDLLSVEFLRLLVDSPFVRKQSAEGTQGIGNKNLVLRTIGAFRIPLPPLAEQHRIVAKVDALMALCDQLKTRLSDAVQTQRHLAHAITHGAAN
ncbi:restriction endonuclease subunit S [Gluconobacter kondonii]|uniref:restriction endonuclease subunit S n=1 Tax=Gluconobacter kondonii TaxID=941463 RepID=UPI001B8D4A14|nr:restriction endonuclease subunit S [Gluconobacter kondonii]MBS1084233.1 restriction endonuclease subunit S [Gluconobacter kondonii]